MVNYSQWHTERSTNKKVHAIEEINVLSGKMDELMKLFASKSVSSDPNDMPLSTLIENNNESMDVNFVGRNNFGNNAYRVNFNSRTFPSNSSNNYGNSYGNPTYNNNRNTSDLESNIKEFISSTELTFFTSRSSFGMSLPVICIILSSTLVASLSVSKPVDLG